MSKILYFLSFILLFFCGNEAKAQNKLRLTNGCNFVGQVKSGSIFYIFDATDEARFIVSDIMNAAGIESNFELKAADVPNALASTENGQRYILFNQQFVREYKYNARNKWAAYVVFAHEIGHHLNGHDLTGRDSSMSKIRELEADRYAGRILNMLGASLDEARSAMEYNTESLKESSTHPAPNQRIAAVLEGWQKHESWKRSHGMVDKKIDAIDLDKCIFCPKMIRVEGGTFQMGSNDGEKNEVPIHQVKLRSFYLGETEVTIAQFRAFVEESGYVTDAEKNGNSVLVKTHGGLIKNANLRSFNWRTDDKGHTRPTSEGDHPVSIVTWNDALKYCEWLSIKTGKKFRLPTEAEWEYVARGGKQVSTTLISKKSDDLTDGWLESNSRGNTHPVGIRIANPLGFKDIIGNVREWCYDCYFSNYKSAPIDGTQWQQANCGFRVIRGGSWSDKPKNATVSIRFNASPDSREDNIGFRVAMD